VFVIVIVVNVLYSYGGSSSYCMVLKDNVQW